MDKPGDFFVGVTDLFSVLLPGAVLTFFAMRVEQSLGHVDLFGLLQLKDAAGYMAFVVSAFLLGHLADMIGATILDRIYDLLYADFMRYRGGFRGWLKGTPRRAAARVGDWFSVQILDRKSTIGQPQLLKDEDPIYLAALALATHKPEGDRLFKWCRDWLQLHNPQSLQEPDRLQANSKFFRGLVIVVMTFVALFSLEERFRVSYSGTLGSDLVWMASCLIVIALSFLRYSDLRWKSAQRVYRLYVISRYDESSKGSAPRP